MCRGSEEGGFITSLKTQKLNTTLLLTFYSQTVDGVVPAQVTDNLVTVSIGLMMDNEGEAVIWRGARKMGLIQVLFGGYS